MPAVDHSPAVAELRRGLDLDVALDSRHESRIDHLRHCERVVNRRAVEAVAVLMEALEEVRELGNRAARLAGVAQAVGVRACEERLVRDVEPDHRHLDAAREHDSRCFGIDERVELRGRGHVPLSHRAAHPDDPLEPFLDLRVPLEEQRHVRERTGRHEHDARLEQNGQEVGGVRRDGRGRGLRQVGPVEPGLAVHVRSAIASS